MEDNAEWLSNFRICERMYKQTIIRNEFDVAAGHKKRRVFKFTISDILLI